MMADVKSEVKRHYGQVARTVSKEMACCSSEVLYTVEELKAIPKGAYIGEGSGNPVALAALKPGEHVLDLGSGAGIDVFLSANKVGPAGRVVGIDLTPEMVERANQLAKSAGYSNVEFRLGDIERLPFPDNSFDAAISNCVINLAEDRNAVLLETFRVLKPGGRFVISDIVRNQPTSPSKGGGIEEGSCASRAVTGLEYERAIEGAGFSGIKTLLQNGGSCCTADGQFSAATILATKPSQP